MVIDITGSSLLAINGAAGATLMGDTNGTCDVTVGTFGGTDAPIVSSAGFAYLGTQGSASSGTMTLNANSQTGFTYMVVGGFTGAADTGAGTITMNDSALLNTGGFIYLGVTGTGVLKMNGSSTCNAATMYVGSSGGNGSITVGGSASLTASGDIDLGGSGNSTANGTGELTVNDQATVVGSNWMQVGVYAVAGNTPTGIVNVNGGLLYVPWVNCGSLGGEAHVNLNGGVFATAGIQTAGDVFAQGFSTGGGTVTFDGGTLQALLDNDDFVYVPAGGATLDVYVEAGGATINTDVYNVGVKLPLQAGATAGGGLTKTGSGKLTLYGNNTYTGATLVQEARCRSPARCRAASRSMPARVWAAAEPLTAPLAASWEPSSNRMIRPCCPSSATWTGQARWNCSMTTLPLSPSARLPLTAM